MAPLKRVLVPWAVVCLMSLGISATIVTSPLLKEKHKNLLWGEYPVTLDTALCSVDCAYERDLVGTGYTADTPLSFWAKYPLMNMSGHIIQQVWDVRAELILLILSRIGVLFGLAELYRLIQAQYGEDKAIRTVWWTICTPTLALYTWVVTYPEGWQLGFTCLTFYLYFKGDYWTASLPAALLAVSRPQGILLLPALGVGILLDRTSNWPERLKRLGAVSLLPVLAWCAWQGYATAVSGELMAPLTSQKVHGRTIFHAPMLPLVRFVKRRFLIGFQTRGIAVEAAQLVLVLFQVLLLIGIWRRGKIRTEITLFTCLTVFVPLHTGLISTARYALATALPWMPVIWPTPQPFKKHEKELWLVFGLLGTFFTLIVISYLNREFKLGWIA